MKEFNMVAATFYLVAAVFAAYATAALMGAGNCLLWSTAPCTDGKLFEAFSTLLASALAYAAGQSSKGSS